MTPIFASHALTHTASDLVDVSFGVDAGCQRLQALPMPLRHGYDVALSMDCDQGQQH